MSDIEKDGVTAPDGSVPTEQVVEVASHASDCAVHNEPAYPAGQCDCAARVHLDKTAYRAVDACGGTYTSEQEASGYAQGHRDALEQACKAVRPVDDLLGSLCGLLLTAAERRRAGDLRDDPDSEDNERFASWYGGQLLALHDAVAAIAKATGASQ